MRNKKYCKRDPLFIFNPWFLSLWSPLPHLQDPRSADSPAVSLAPCNTSARLVLKIFPCALIPRAESCVPLALCTFPVNHAEQREGRGWSLMGDPSANSSLGENSKLDEHRVKLSQQGCKHMPGLCSHWCQVVVLSLLLGRGENPIWELLRLRLGLRLRFQGKKANTINDSLLSLCQTGL